VATKAKVKSKAKMKTKPAAKAKAKAKVKAKAAAKAKPKMAAKPAAKTKAAPVKNLSSALITPLEDRVIVQVDLAEEKTAGGLYIPTSASERPNRGQVVAAGPGRRNKKGKLRPLDVKTGDCVLFPQYAGTKINVGKDEFLILREDEVLGIVT
jgi:chaperonin GroES